jgi:CDP-diacylglycerol--glycerol-3-phosphate 3-phosphatidyltransferase
VIAASPGGKAKTLVQILAIGLYVLPLPPGLHWIGVSFMVAAVILTVVTGVDYLARAAALVSKPRNQSTETSR